MMNPGLRGRQVPEPSGLDVDKENEAGSSEVLQRAIGLVTVTVYGYGCTFYGHLRALAVP